MKIHSDLNSAREIYRNEISQIQNITRLTAVRSLIIKATQEKNRTFLQNDLARILKREKLDMLTIVDGQGVVICRGGNPALYGDRLTTDDEFVRIVLQTKKPVSGTGLVSSELLSRESKELAGRATLHIIPTRKSKPRARSVEQSGMMQKSAVPIIGEDGTFSGVIIGGKLLNRNYEIVDKIKHIVHAGEMYEGNEIGTATIFQHNLRISTNVLNDDGTRAIATLVSEEVDDAVLTNGQQWIGEAFVVNAPYIAAYEPIRDIDGNIVGILYVGILKKPFNDVLFNGIITFLGIVLAGMLLVITVAWYQAKRISEPLQRLDDFAKSITSGDYQKEFTLSAPYEIEYLAESLKQMADQLAKEHRALQEWATTLEQKVEERTTEIKNIHSQLFRSEKLASLGKLAAGVAHEINNPLTGILTNASLLYDDLEHGDPRRDDADVIVKETIRCREIVKRLLDFARQTQPQKKMTNINLLIENIILLVRNQTSFRNIQIDKRLDPAIPELLADTDQIQQVFINLILNASEAMSTGGMLLIETKISGTQISISFTDTGVGISEEVKDRIFDPFYTTKEHGTGLGLSISYGIIEQHGGSIQLASRKGIGSTFTVQLPLENTQPR